MALEFRTTISAWSTEGQNDKCSCITILRSKETDSIVSWRKFKRSWKCVTPGWSTNSVRSRALTKSQQNDEQLEKETLAITFGCGKFHQYVYGREVIVEGDQKPLQAILSKPLFKSPLRLQRLLLDLQKYHLKVTCKLDKPRKSLFFADHLSRAYSKESKEDLISDSELKETHTNCNVCLKILRFTKQEFWSKFDQNWSRNKKDIIFYNL